MTILPQTSRREINWWLQQLEHLYGKQMGMSSVKETDASKTGWGQYVSLRTLRWGDHGVPQKKKIAYQCIGPQGCTVCISITDQSN